VGGRRRSSAAQSELLHVSGQGHDGGSRGHQRRLNGTPTYEYSYELTPAQAAAFNPWNLLRATPTGVADDWDPAGVRDIYEMRGQAA
jgi:hypothetical protein